MKAIPTTYNNVKFKSKLEAKWAVWLDEHNIIWDYETQGFDLNGTWYLPDFYLPEINTIIEVKGAMERLEKPYGLIESLKTYSEKGEKTYCPDETLMVLLAGPVPWFYNINWSYDNGFFIYKCSSCGVTNIVTDYMSYGCRSCGEHKGVHHMLQRESVKVLTKPLEWLLLEVD